MGGVYVRTVFGGSAGATPAGGPALLPLPSHQELVARAQCIMQKALLKQELEKSKEVIEAASSKLWPTLVEGLGRGQANNVLTVT